MRDPERSSNQQQERERKPETRGDQETGRKNEKGDRIRKAQKYE
jgi:hypothetical protein